MDPTLCSTPREKHRHSLNGDVSKLTDQGVLRHSSRAMHGSHGNVSGAVKRDSSSSSVERNNSIKSTGKRAQFQSFVNSPINVSADRKDQDDAHPPSTNSNTVFLGPRSKSEGKLFSLDKSSSSLDNNVSNSYSKLSKRESLKVQKKHYRKEKKRAAKELLCTLKDPSVIVLADWLKVRGTLKSWTKLWCVLKPGLLVLYKSQKAKSSHWVGTILLNTCKVIERPSKKDGFCFKLFHPLDQSIWTTKGPKGENIGAITQPLPYSHIIFRAMSEAAGKCWMDALELALRCSSLLIRTMTKGRDQSTGPVSESFMNTSFNLEKREDMNESDCERHFKDETGEDIRIDREETKSEENKSEKSETESEASEDEDDKIFDDNYQPVETHYIENQAEELGQQGDACQTEEVADENKSLIWSLVKQVRPGMDLSKVVLPTFILEPRSFLDKLSDYYYHADFLSDAVNHENPYSRMKMVVRWYLSGFYKKPKGLKKPYNPILGETFRCCWKHQKTGIRTFYVAEQISHHPPVTAFHVTNRQDGFTINGSILAKSKFYGNSLSAILDGVGTLTFLKRGEDYLVTMPYAHCKGILIGTLSMEYGGKVTIECEKTGYRCEMEFKLKPFLGSDDISNRIVGKIKLGSETLSTVDGHWDAEVYIKEKSSGETSLFWNPTPEVKSRRLKRYTVPLIEQGEFESERLWARVSAAIVKCDQEEATQEKYVLEEAQRKEARERKVTMMDWLPKLFERDLVTGDWIYKYADSRPWDVMNDVVQYESEYVIQTKTHHKTPIIRANSILSVEDSGRILSKAQSIERARVAARIKHNVLSKRLREVSGRESGSSTPEHGLSILDESDTSDEGATNEIASNKLMTSNLEQLLQPIIDLSHKNNERLAALQGQFFTLQRQQQTVLDNSSSLQTKDFLLLAVFLVLQAIMTLMFK